MKHKETFFIKRGEKQTSGLEINEIFGKSNLEKTLSERLLSLGKFYGEKIKERNTKRNIRNTRKQDEGKLKREDRMILRLFESGFQNDALRLIIGRDRFFSKKELDDRQIELLNMSSTQMYHTLYNPEMASSEGKKITTGISSVYNFIANKYSNSREQYDYDKDSFFIGTNNYLDAAHEIDLIIYNKKDLELVQIKTSEMKESDVEKINKKHSVFIEKSKKDSLDHLHDLVETYTDELYLEKIKEGDIFKEYIESISDFLEWLMASYEEKKESSIDNQCNIDDDLLNEAFLLSEKDEHDGFDYGQMTILFQKGDVLHNIFMHDGGQYSELIDKIHKNINILTNKEIKKIKNEGIISILYDDNILKKVLDSEVFDKNESNKFLSYVDFMRALDLWSINFKENMNSEEAEIIYENYYKLLGFDRKSMIHNVENIYSVVVHGGKEVKKLLNKP